MSVSPFPFVCAVAAIVWIAAEIPVVRGIVRRFRSGGSRRLAALACFCVAADLAVLALGVATIIARDLDGITPGWWRYVNWPTSLAALAMTFVPIGLLFSLFGVIIVADGILRCSGAALLPGLAGLLLGLLLLVSPVVRYRLLRRPSRRGLAVFACLTAYLPLFPLFASMVWGGAFGKF